MTGDTMFWSLSPLSRWTPRDSRYRQELPGAAPLGPMGGYLAGAGRGWGHSRRAWRMLHILARRRLYKRRP
jgi:hypothetical protein